MITIVSRSSNFAFHFTDSSGYTGFHSVPFSSLQACMEAIYCFKLQAVSREGYERRVQDDGLYRINLYDGQRRLLAVCANLRSVNQREAIIERVMAEVTNAPIQETLT